METASKGKGNSRFLLIFLAILLLAAASYVYLSREAQPPATDAPADTTTQPGQP